MSNETGRVLGIDLGASSLGTALLDWKEKQVVFTGVRIFKAGVDNLDESKEASRAAGRRMARLQRRQTDRRRRRLQSVFRLLQSNGLLPAGARDAAYFARMDLGLVEKFGHPEKLPYAIRAAALDQRLEAFELGRAIFHLSQRRGFLSNRKQQAKDDEETGKVKAGIATLQTQLNESGARTLGEYFARHLDPKLQNRIRTLYTHRSWYEHEFEQIWEAQTRLESPHCTDSLGAKLRSAIFFQRPLKSQKDKIGRCFLETAERRAPNALLEVQRFRVWKTINDLRVYTEEGTDATLTAEQRSAVFAYCCRMASPTLAGAKRELGLPKTAKFTLEAGGQKTLPTLRTHHELLSKMGRAWTDMPADRQEALADALIDLDHPEEELLSILQSRFGLDEPSARAAMEAKLPDGYFSLSLAAIRKLLPHLENGQNDTKARFDVYGDGKRCEPVETLPPLTDERVKNLLGDIVNPIVIRALTEMRKTVNAILRRYGKPDAIHVELARDVRKNSEERMRIQKNMREQEKRREQARKTIADCMGMPEHAVRRGDIEKYLLAQECGFRCPYSGHPISMEALFGQHALFHIEHIIPLSWSLDDSFANKTLCHRDLNAVKSDRTPWQAFGHSGDWENMVARVKSWPEPNKAKLARFVMTETEREKLLEEFSSRQLNDTRYASRLAAMYLGMLYGGKNDADGRQRVLTCSGPVTAYLRRTWDFNRILNKDEPVKSRDDHRHHAVDAAAIALCSQGMIQRYSRAVSSAAEAGRPRKVQLDLPWTGFREELETKILATNVSKRPEYKLQAAMHDETHYSPPKGKGGTVHVRKPVNKDLNVEEIVDSRIREAVQAKVDELGSKAKLGLDGNWPVLQQRGGKSMPIKRVRVRKSETPSRLISRGVDRWVLSKPIHHTAILRDESGKKAKFDFETVSVVEAVRRQAKGEPVVSRSHVERVELLCTLRSGDVIEYAVEGLPYRHWLVRTVKRNGQMAINPVSDARLKADIEKARPKVFLTPSVGTAFKEGARKISISPLGAVFPCHD